MEVRNIENIKIEKNLELAVLQYNLHTTAMKDFRHIVGVNPDALGEPSEIRPGVGVKAKVAMTNLIVAPVFDNTKRRRVSYPLNRPTRFLNLKIERAVRPH